MRVGWYSFSSFVSDTFAYESVCEIRAGYSSGQFFSIVCEMSCGLYEIKRPLLHYSFLPPSPPRHTLSPSSTLTWVI